MILKTWRSLGTAQKAVALPFTTAAGRDGKVNSAESRAEMSPQSHLVELTLWKIILAIPIRNGAWGLQSYLPLCTQTPLPPATSPSLSAIKMLWKTHGVTTRPLTDVLFFTAQWQSGPAVVICPLATNLKNFYARNPVKESNTWDSTS